MKQFLAFLFKIDKDIAVVELVRSRNLVNRYIRAGCAEIGKHIIR